jgi:hypothetical protein
MNVVLASAVTVKSAVWTLVAAADRVTKELGVKVVTILWYAVVISILVATSGCEVVELWVSVTTVVW